MIEKKDKNDIELIGPVLPADLERAIFDKKMDEKSKKILDDEEEYIKAWRKYRGEESKEVDGSLIGLGLSGGGIRSATFCLGVIQALASNTKVNLFNKVDYLSTVSGGGYIGSSITWLMNRMGKDVMGKAPFPYGSGAESPLDKNEKDLTQKQQAENLKYLREHGNYLTPGNGITPASAIAVFLRGMLLNLVVWIPFFLSIMLVISVGSKGIAHSDWYEKLVVNNMYKLEKKKEINDEDFCIKSILCKNDRDSYSLFKVIKYHPVSFLFLLGSIVCISVFISRCVVYSIKTWRDSRSGPKTDLDKNESSFESSRAREDRYCMRRKFEKDIGVLILTVVGLFVLGSFPLVAQVFHYEEGLGATLSGILAGLWTYMKSGSVNGSNEGKGSKLPMSIVASLGSMLFIYGLVFLSFLISFDLVGGFTNEFEVGRSVYLIGFALLLFIVSIILGKCVNLNFISIHRYYRDRLMESFMPDDPHFFDLDKKEKSDLEKKEGSKCGPGYGANKSRIYQVSEKSRSPYHIVNTNLVLVDSNTRRYRMRGGDNFILSPKYCGSNATGWIVSKKFMGGDMTLSTAMAISGAAANPNTGVGGKGLTRNRFVSLLMALLNIRLGYWIPNPTGKHDIQPNHFDSAAYEILPGVGYEENQKFLQLSDGGHFENNAIYELIRRRCKLIIVCDAGADLDFSFSDFQNSLKRIEVDFGAKIYFNENNYWEKMIPSEEEQEGGKSVYPPGVKFAKQGYIEGTIVYSNGERSEEGSSKEEWKDEGKGKLILLKTTMVKNANFEVKGYKAGNPDFPDETTADQFFSEEQFEAYRKLGKKIGGDMIDGTELEQLIKELEEINN